MSELAKLSINYTSYSSPNYWPYNNGIEALCLHGTAGGFAGSIARLLDPKEQASANFIIDEQGNIFCLVRPGWSAWGNGIVNNPDLSVPWLATAIAQSINPNTKTISIEHVATSYNMTHHIYDSMPAAQKQASIKLVLALCADFNIPIIRNRIIGHYQIDSVSRLYCPGVIDLSAYVVELAKEVVGVIGQVNNLNPDGDPNAWHCIVPGLDFWVINDGDVKFLDYWRANGRLAEFGYPISGARPASDGSGRVVQYFQRTRLEYDPKTKTISRGLVAADYLALAGAKAL